MDAKWLLSRAGESGQGWLSTVILLERVAQDRYFIGVGGARPLLYSTGVCSDERSSLGRLL